MFNLLILLLMNICLVKSSEDQVLIHGPETPVYNVTFVSGHVKVQTLRQKLPSLAAKYSYEDAIHPKLLVVVDYKDYIKDGEQKSLDRAAEIIKGINSYYHYVTSTPWVEALLAGVVLMAEQNDYSGPSTFRMYVQRMKFTLPDCNKRGYCFQSAWTVDSWEDYALSGSELKRFTDWWKITEKQCEHLDYDAFIYSFPCYLSAGSWMGARTVWSLSNGRICTLKPGAIVTNLFGDGHSAFARELSYLLGVTNDQDKSDSHYYTHEELDVEWNNIVDWRNRTAATVEKNYRREKYSCLKKSAKENTDYDDE